MVVFFTFASLIITRLLEVPINLILVILCVFVALSYSIRTTKDPLIEPFKIYSFSTLFSLLFLGVETVCLGITYFSNLEWYHFVLYGCFLYMDNFLVLNIANTRLSKKDMLVDRVNIECLNLNMHDFVKNKIYLTNWYYSFKKYRIFKMKFDELFPENVSNKKIIIVNHPFVKLNENVEHVKDEAYCFIAVNDHLKKKTYKFNVIMEYLDDKGKKQKRKLVLYVKFKKIKGEIVAVTKYVHYYSKIFSPFRFIDIKYWGDNTFKFRQLYRNSYQYFSEMGINHNGLLLEEIYESRKWVHHDGDFGVGKTSMDILAVSNIGRMPVVVSPWEDHYDKDVLALIFKKVSEQCNKLFYWPTKSVSAIFILEVVPLIVAVYNVLMYIQKNLLSAFFSNIRMESLSILLSDLKTNFEISIPLIFEFKFDFDVYSSLIIAIISVLVGVLLASYLLPHLILFRKDSAKCYQSFFVKEIYKMLKKYRMVLIVEDIDRLKQSAIEDVMRTVATLNDACSDLKRVVGILSYDSENIPKIENDKNILYDLENKVIYDKIFENYDAKESMRYYLKKSLSGIMYLNDQKDTFATANKLKQLIDTMPLDEYNFRDIHKYLDNLEKEPKLTEERAIELISEFFKKHNVNAS